MTMPWHLQGTVYQKQLYPNTLTYNRLTFVMNLNIYPSRDCFATLLILSYESFNDNIWNLVKYIITFKQIINTFYNNNKNFY